MSSDWKKIATEKRKAVEALIPSEWLIHNAPSNEEKRDVTKYIQEFLSDRELEITETDAVGIAQKTTSGEWKALEVIKAFTHRASLAHQLTNCLLEIFFEDAYKQAQGLDDYLAEHKRPVGPLHGVPISLKDQLHVKGVETTMGYVGWIGTFQGVKGTGKEKVFESVLTADLRALGAVLYCKTSVPHTLMSGETANNIMGYAWNPKNRNLSAGGSSGGEGALIGLKGSPLGFGTDIGGSIRIPAAFNGLFGLRPSSGRLPYQGMANSFDGQNSILSVVGPLASSARSLQLVAKAVLSRQPWLHDPLVVELPWRDEQEKEMQELLANSKTKLSIGVLRDDGICTPHPPISRAIEIVAKTLEKLGHEVITWCPPTHQILNNLSAITFTYDGGADAHRAFALSGETPVTQIATVINDEPAEEMTATQIAANNVAKREAQKAYMDYWNNTAERTKSGRPVDAFISPVAPFTAARPGTYRYVGYSSFVNMLDYTSVVVPVTTVDKSVDVWPEGAAPRDKHDKYTFDTYDPDIFDGAHVSVQLVGRRLQEEKMLALASYIEDALREQQA